MLADRRALVLPYFHEPHLCLSRLFILIFKAKFIKLGAELFIIGKM
jgi:hypothetical protein